MTLRIVFRRAAKSEFEDAAVWYDEQRRGLGEEFIIEIEQSLVSAAASPQRYQVVFGDIRFSLATSIPTMHAASFIVLTFLVCRL